MPDTRESFMLKECRYIPILKTERLTEFIGRETEYRDSWGAIRIVKNGKTLWETSRDYSCAEFGVKNTMVPRFTVASVTKQFMGI